MTSDQAIKEIQEEQCGHMYSCNVCLKEECPYYIAILAIQFREEMRKRAKEERD